MVLAPSEESIEEGAYNNYLNAESRQDADEKYEIVRDKYRTRKALILAGKILPFMFKPVPDVA